jgi:hypothetical protein
VTPYSTDGALRAFLTPYSTDGCFARFLGRIFQARNGREVVSSEKCLVGQVASVAGAAGAAVSRRCGVGVVLRSGRKRAEADGALLLASSGTPYR